jgi:hypothetical protein
VAGTPLPVAAGPVAPSPEYRLQAGDVLEIKHFYTPELNETLSIRPDGRISLPIAGEVEAAGQTPAGLRDVLSERYARTLRDREVAVVVKEFAGRGSTSAGRSTHLASFVRQAPSRRSRRSWKPGGPRVRPSWRPSSS